MIAMILYLLIATIGTKSLMGIRNTLIAVATSVVVDMLYCKITNRKSSRDGTVITGIIISLILSITTPWFYVVGTAVMAILSKHIFVYKKKPIFNPAAFGLLLSIFIFQTEQSWWGAFGDLRSWLVIFLIIGGYIVTDRVNKFPQVFAFLGTFIAILFLMGIFHIGDAGDAFRQPFINAAVFFALFMLTDPPTSPAKYKNQILFGLVSAVSAVIVYGIFGGLTYLFIGLLIGNLYSYWHKRSTANAVNFKQQQVKLS